MTFLRITNIYNKFYYFVQTYHFPNIDIFLALGVPFDIFELIGWTNNNLLVPHYDVRAGPLHLFDCFSDSDKEPLTLGADARRQSGHKSTFVFNLITYSRV